MDRNAGGLRVNGPMDIVSGQLMNPEENWHEFDVRGPPEGDEAYLYCLFLCKTQPRAKQVVRGLLPRRRSDISSQEMRLRGLAISRLVKVKRKRTNSGELPRERQ
jgi:hypothetical protein